MTKTKKTVAVKDKSKPKPVKASKVRKPPSKKKKATKNLPESKPSGSGTSKPARKVVAAAPREENNNVVYDKLLIFDIKLPTQTPKYNPVHLVMQTFI